MTTTTGTQFDPLSKAFADDPYAVYKTLREADGPTWFAPANLWLLTRHADVSQVATDPTMVRSLDGIETAQEATLRRRQANWDDMPYHQRFVQVSLLDSDGEPHRRLRRLLLGKFTTTAVAGLEPMVQQIVDGLLDQLAGGARIEFIADFAAHIPGLVIAHILGAPPEYSGQMRQWSEDVVQFFDVDRSDARKTLAETATREFHDFLVDLRAERRKRPQDDLISHMIADEAAGQYQGDEFISTCMLILMAGHGSTIDVLGSGLHLLLKHPDAMQALRKHPEKLPVAIQEIFRYEPPLPFFHRHATAETRIGDRVWPAGTTFGLLYGAANRDPAMFADPDSFQIERSPNRHLSFGQGAHLCLGNNVARLNMKVIFQTLLSQFQTIELAQDQVSYKRGLSVRGPVALNVDLSPSR
ncbi:cytochrome P450 [Paracoccus sp. M683]|uniref:cytochrome P450 n=1 Tax=Paracoccus sp. M683 TaxID=2594268 RepID=UPI001181763E|nr:cytochrome P450 [Paracoccus sp. M683]TRW97527.1 cytochrome P450 [Paracoccus sp. M683]